jgi:hypothetical protein
MFGNAPSSFPLSRAAQGRVVEGYPSPAALYDDWLLAESDATLALGTWRAAKHGAKARAYAAYASALNREASAANLLAARLGRA